MDGSALERVLHQLRPRGRDRSELAVDDLAEACAAVMSVPNVAIQIRAPGRTAVGVGASSPLAQQAEDEQLTWGEGPSVTAVEDGELVLVVDVAGDDRWPMVRDGLQSRGVRGIASFPVQLGASRLGAMTNYRTYAGPMEPDEVQWGVQVAKAAMIVLVASDPSDGLGSSALGDVGWVAAVGDANWSVVHQATGMVAVQVGSTLDDAVARLIARAYASEVSILELSRAVVARQVRFVS